MPDWTRSMKQTFEYVIVDPGTWGDVSKLTDVESCSITRDLDDETLGSASLTCDTDHSDEYVRTYLVTEQDGIRERIPLGTHIYETPSTKFDGKKTSLSQDGYSPLIELKEKPPQLGYALLKGTNIMELAGRLCSENMRAPVVRGESSDTLEDNFVSDTEDTWLTFLTDLISCAQFRFDIDDTGRILFARKQDITALQPIWTFDDGNSSILYPDVTVDRDLYGVPNVIEVVYSPTDGTPIFSRVVNDDPNSIISTVSRGREVVYRETSPSVVEGINQAQLDDYARNKLKELSSLEYKVSYRHGYCPVRIGDCVRLNYVRAGLEDVKAMVTRQTIKCESGCSVDETAVFTRSLWG